MQKILGKISQWLADENVIEQKDKGLYEYALKSVLITICPFIAALVIGSLMGMIKEAVLLIIPFMIIRRFSGGYHTKNIWTCLILSCGLIAGFTYLSQYIDNKWVISFITAAASIELMVLGPVDSVNYRLTYDEKQYFKKILIVLIFLADVAALAVFSSGFFRYSVCVMLGIILTSALHLLRVLQHFFAKTEFMNGESR